MFYFWDPVVGRHTRSFRYTARVPKKPLVTLVTERRGGATEIIFRADALVFVTDLSPKP
jgi:hypothetical protein